MRQIIGLGIFAVAAYYLFFAEPPRPSYKTREEFLAEGMVMVFDQKLANNLVNDISAADIKGRTELDFRIQRLGSPHATAEDFQAGCDAIDEIKQSLNM